jgi:hypothetical protein
MPRAPHSAWKDGQLHPHAGAGWLCRCGLGLAPQRWIPGLSAGTASHRQETPTCPRSGMTGAMRAPHAPSGERQLLGDGAKLARSVSGAGHPAPAALVGGGAPLTLSGAPPASGARLAALPRGRACVRGQWGRPV